MTTDFSDWWAYSSLSGKYPKVPLLSLPLNKEDQSGTYRWRAKLVKSEAEFNSLTPNKIHIQVELLIEMQFLLKEHDKWSNINFDRTAIENMSDSLKKDINRRYYKYLNDRYDFTVTLPGFKGLNEQ